MSNHTSVKVSTRSDLGLHPPYLTGEAREVANLDGEMTAESVKIFVLGEKLPLTLEFSQANSEKIFNSGISKQVRSLVWQTIGSHMLECVPGC